MPRLTITLPGEQPQIVHVDNAHIHHRNGLPTLGLTRPHATRLVEAWARTYPSRSSSASFGIDSALLSLDEPEGRIERYWMTGLDDNAFPREYWPVASFPFPMQVTNWGDRPERLLSADDALDRIANYLNEPGSWNGGDVCETVAEIVSQSGRYIFE